MSDPLAMPIRLDQQRSLSEPLLATRSAGIDALRGLCVISVILLHLNIRLHFERSGLAEGVSAWLTSAVFWSGFYGVETFFVISGFLITTISLRRWGSLAQIDLTAFYKLRAARICPTLVLLLAALSVFHLAGVPGFVIDPTRSTLVRALWAALTFHVNVLQADVGLLPACWDVLWSLSIEEMFYLVFPLLCVLARREAIVVLLLATVVAIGPFARTMGVHETDPQDQTYLCCMDAIAMGCLAGLLSARARLSKGACRVLIVFGIAAVVFVDCLRNAVAAAGLVSNGLYITVLAVGVAFILVAIAGGVGRAFFALGTGLTRAFGRASYEIYLTHSFVVLAVVAAFRRAPDSLPLPVWFALGIGLSYALGAIVFRFYSEPVNIWLRGAATIPLPPEAR